MSPYFLLIMEKTLPTNPDSYFPRLRLAYLERYAKAHGSIPREALSKVFGISKGRAGLDLQAYQKLNPGALAYDLSARTYRWAKGAKLAIKPPPWQNFPHGEATGMPRTTKRTANASNEDRFFCRLRLAYLERHAKASGTLNRLTMVSKFDVAPAVVSRDITRYQQLNPEALTYDGGAKEFLWNPHAKLIIECPLDELHASLSPAAA